MGYWASFTQKALAIHGLVLLWWCVSTAWFLLLKCHYVKKKKKVLELWLCEMETEIKVVASTWEICLSGEGGVNMWILLAVFVAAMKSRRNWCFPALLSSEKWPAGEEKMSSLINPSCSSLAGWVQEFCISGSFCSAFTVFFLPGKWIAL